MTYALTLWSLEVEIEVMPVARTCERGTVAAVDGYHHYRFTRIIWETAWVVLEFMTMVGLRQYKMSGHNEINSISVEYT